LGVMAKEKKKRSSPWGWFGPPQGPKTKKYIYIKGVWFLGMAESPSWLLR
jgi:hypothetical protein